MTNFVQTGSAEQWGQSSPPDYWLHTTEHNGGVRSHVVAFLFSPLLCKQQTNCSTCQTHKLTKAVLAYCTIVESLNDLSMSSVATRPLSVTSCMLQVLKAHFFGALQPHKSAIKFCLKRKNELIFVDVFRRAIGQARSCRRRLKPLLCQSWCRFRLKLCLMPHGVGRQQPHVESRRSWHSGTLGMPHRFQCLAASAVILQSAFTHAKPCFSWKANVRQSWECSSLVFTACRQDTVAHVAMAAATMITWESTAIARHVSIGSQCMRNLIFGLL